MLEPKRNFNEISIETTWACGCCCIMCSSNALHPKLIDTEKELSEVEIKKLLLDAKRTLNPMNFSVSGGEPLIKDCNWEILEYSRELGYKILFYTTGLKLSNPEYKELEPITEKELMRFKALDATLIFDVQSCDEKRQDKIMGVDGVYEKEIGVIKKALELKIPLQTHFVPQVDNYKDIVDTVNFLDDLGVETISFLRLVEQGRCKENHLELDKKKFKEMQYVFYRLLHEKNKNIKIRLGHPINFQSLIDEHAPFKPCRGAIDAPLIQPLGQVATCPAFKDLPKAGNIRENSLEEIWYKSELYKVLREFIHGDGWKEITGKCSDCPFLSQCKGKCTAQRLIHNVPKDSDIPLYEAIKIGADPLCWFLD